MPQFRYVVHSRLKKIFHHARVVRTWIEGEHTYQELEPVGYFIVIEGSYEALFVGTEEPELKPGDQIRISIERLVP